MSELSPIQKELLDRADSIFKSIADTVNTGVEFAKDQIPDIAYQYIAMERVYLTSVVAMIVLTFIVSTYATWKFTFKNCMNIEGYDAESRYIALLPYALVAIGCTVTFFAHLKPLIMVWFAPKIFIITNIVTLIKG